MDMTLLKNVCASTEIALARAGEAVDSIFTNVIENNYADPEYGGHLSDEDNTILIYHIERCVAAFLIALDALELTETRHKLLHDWQSFEKLGLHKLRLSAGNDSMISDPLTYLHNVHNGLKSMLDSPESSLEEFLFERLCTILRATPTLLWRKGKTPHGEMEIQEVMHDYLKAFFPDFVHNPQIDGTIRTFKPDCGIRNLSVAIEFKYANSIDDIKKALTGIFEDISGYSGSKDWTRFVSVIYQTAPFETESRFKEELRRAKALSWTPILVNGHGDREKPKKTPKSSPP